MRNKFKYSINYIAVQIALPSILIGIFCLLLFKNNSDTGIVGIGYFLVLTMGITNSIMLLPLIVNTLRRLKDIREHFKALSLILINIPLSGIYLEIL